MAEEKQAVAVSQRVEVMRHEGTESEEKKKESACVSSKFCLLSRCDSLA